MRQRYLLILLFILFFISFAAYNANGACTGQPHAADLTGYGTPFPDEYGAVIFRCNENSPKQLYIIGMSHRDTLTRENGDKTVRSQMEVYRIIEGIMKGGDLNLVLPEGYIGGNGEADMPVTGYYSNSASGHFDTETLKKRLVNDNEYVNAEMLLMDSHGVHIRQIEDHDLYHAVLTRIDVLEKKGDDSLSGLYVRSELGYLQERRVAAMLQNVPDVIDGELKAGKMSSPHAVLTIGLNHLEEIIRHLKKRKITIPSPAFTPFDDYIEDLNLLKHGFGVTVIVPRSLTGESDLLMLTKVGPLY